VLLATLAFFYLLFAALIAWMSERAFTPDRLRPLSLVAGSYRIKGSRQWDRPSFGR